MTTDIRQSALSTQKLEAFDADHLVTGSDYPVSQDYEAYKETFAYARMRGRGRE